MRLKSQLLGHHNSRLFLTVTLVVGFGNTALSLVASVWVLSLTGSASLAALCGLCVYAPSLAGPLLGTLVDRLPRRRLLIATCLAMAIALLTLLAVRDRSQTWLIFVVMTAYGASLVLVDAGESALLQGGVPEQLRGRLNSARVSVQEAMKLIAPAVGALIFTVAGGRAVAALSAAAMLAAASLYTGIHYGHVAEKHEHRLMRQTMDGLRYLFATPELRSIVLATAATVSATGLVPAATFIVITQDLQRAPAFAGILGTAQGAGSVLGGLVGGRLLRRTGERGLNLLGALLTGIGMLGSVTAWTPAVVAGQIVVGVGLPWTVVAAFTAVQRLTSSDLIGRVSANAGTLVFAPVALTTGIGAALVELIDHRIVVLTAVGICLAVAGPIVRRAQPSPALAGGEPCPAPRHPQPHAQCVRRKSS